MANKEQSEAQVSALRKYRENRRSFQIWTTHEQYEMFEKAKERYKLQNSLTKISYADLFTALCETYLNHEQTP